MYNEWSHNDTWDTSMLPMPTYHQTALRPHAVIDLWRNQPWVIDNEFIPSALSFYRSVRSFITTVFIPPTIEAQFLHMYVLHKPSIHLHPHYTATTRLVLPHNQSVNR